MTDLARLPDRVDIREVGPRDGLQIEAPIIDRGQDPAAARAGRDRRAADRGDRVRLAAGRAGDGRRRGGRRVRADRPGHRMVGAGRLAERCPRAVGSGLRTIEYVVSAADGHSQANARRSTQEALDAVDEVAQVVHDAGGRLEVIIATAWDCPFDGPTAGRADRVDRGARGASSARTSCASATPSAPRRPVRVWRLFDAVRAAMDGAPGGDPVPLGAHFHNTRGTGIASAFAAVQAGVTQLDASVGGPRWLPVRARRERQHRHRGTGLSARRRRHQHRRRPGRDPGGGRGRHRDLVGHRWRATCSAPAGGSCPGSRRRCPDSPPRLPPRRVPLTRRPGAPPDLPPDQPDIAPSCGKRRRPRRRSFPAGDRHPSVP